MSISRLDLLFNEGLNYLNFYDSISFASENNLLGNVKDQNLLTRLSNSVLNAALSLNSEDPIFEDIRSASFFLRDADEMFNKSTETVTSWKNLSLDEVRKSILEAILAYEKYVVYLGVYSFLNMDEATGKLPNVSKEYIMENFPEASEEEVENTAELYLDYITQLQEMGLEEEVMSIDYTKTGKEMWEYEDDEDIEIDLTEGEELPENLKHLVGNQQKGMEWEGDK